MGLLSCFRLFNADAGPWRACGDDELRLRARDIARSTGSVPGTEILRMKRVEVLRGQSAELRRLALTFDPLVRDKFLKLARQTDELAMEVSREI